MKASKVPTLLAVAITLSGCVDSTGIHLTGIWVATSHEYESAAGEVVDIIARDGARTSISIDRVPDGWRVSVSMDDGQEDTSVLFGTINDQRFTLGTTVWNFERNGEEMTVTDPDDTFDFG